MGQKVSSSPRSRAVYGSPYQSTADTAGASSSNTNSGQYLSVSNGHGAYFNPGQSNASAGSSNSRNRTRSLVCTPTHSQHANNGQTHQGTSSESNSDDEVLDRIIGAVGLSRSGAASRHANGHTRANRGRSLPLSAPLPTHFFPQTFFSGKEISLLWNLLALAYSNK